MKSTKYSYYNKNLISSLDYKSLFLNSVRFRYQDLLIGILISFTAIYLLQPLISKLIYSYTKKVIPARIVKNNSKQPTTTYIVQSGDDLWAIAERQCGSGFNAYDIAKINNITDPSLIVEGQKLIIPNVAPKFPTTGDINEGVATARVQFTGNKYTVKEGDCLASIAVEAYGDDQAWIRIAQANHIANPDLLEKGTVLVIPR